VPDSRPPERLSLFARDSHGRLLTDPSARERSIGVSVLRHYHPSIAVASPTVSLRATLAGWCFGALWFLAAPAAFVFALLRWADSAGGTGGQLLEIVRDQRVPVSILVFTLVEMVLYQLRYRLPFAARVRTLGPVGLTRELREQFQGAQAFLAQTERALRQRQPAPARAQLQRALTVLRSEVAREPLDAPAFRTAFAAARQLAAEQLGGLRQSEARRTLESLGAAALIALALRAFVFEAFRIPSGSMLPTLQIGDHIFVNKLHYGVRVPFTDLRLFPALPPERGDVVVFEFPDDDPRRERQDFVKRVIALPGDTLAAERGHPVINGWPVPFCRAGRYRYGGNDGRPQEWAELDVEFLDELAYLTLYAEQADPEYEHEGPFHVPAGEVYVMGDNRNDSLDSRRWRQGAGGGVPDANLRGRASRVWLPLSRLMLPIMGSPRLPEGMPAELTRGVEQCLARWPAQTRPPG
jgi:signal peptidase I